MRADETVGRPGPQTRPGESKSPTAAQCAARFQPARLGIERGPAPAGHGFRYRCDAVLRRAGAAADGRRLQPDPNIRKTIDQEATPDAGTSKDLMDKLAFWQNSTLHPVTAGATPTIKRKTKSLLDSIF